MANSPPSNGTGNSIPILFYAGEALGQKGQGAAVAILLLPTGKRTSVKQSLGSVTSNEASYRALLIGLQKAWQLGIREIEVKGHNEKVFNQVNGLEEIDQPPLRHLHREVLTVMKQFDRVMVEWIPLDQNRPAYQTVQKCLATAARSPKVHGLPLPDPFATDHGDLYQEGPSEAKDTVPTVDQVQQIVSMIMDLSPREKTRLVKDLAQLPELSNQFLTAIADRLKLSGN
jgi:ribonuclease HI